MRLMGKPDGGKVRRIIRQKRKGETTARRIAAATGISGARVRKLWARYRHAKEPEIRYPLPVGGCLATGSCV